MTQSFSNDYRDPRLAKSLSRQIVTTSKSPVRLMEVCGTHTMAIFRHGIRSLLPETITLLSGPGCPVCVTDQTDLDAMIGLAQYEDVIMATFGDLIRVPGSSGSLQQARSQGADVRVVYSPLDAVTLARENPGRMIVFPAVGFETTAPTIAATLITARQAGLDNFCIYPAHKTVPHALNALMTLPQTRIDGFLLPGHVSVIVGVQAYADFWRKYQIPCVVAGFEPVDILEALLDLIRQVETSRPRLANAYPRAVTDQGNPTAKEMMARVFEPCDARWRGIGVIPDSGLAVREEFAAFDARQHFNIEVIPAAESKACACGEILTGIKTPPQCALFRRTCTPMTPVGPCMVSSEGTCAAYYRYHEE